MLDGGVGAARRGDARGDGCTLDLSRVAANRTRKGAAALGSARRRRPCAGTGRGNRGRRALWGLVFRVPPRFYGDRAGPGRPSGPPRQASQVRPGPKGI